MKKREERGSAKKAITITLTVDDFEFLRAEAGRMREQMRAQGVFVDVSEADVMRSLIGTYRLDRAGLVGAFTVDTQTLAAMQETVDDSEIPEGLPR